MTMDEPHKKGARRKGEKFNPPSAPAFDSAETTAPSSPKSIYCWLLVDTSDVDFGSTTIRLAYRNFSLLTKKWKALSIDKHNSQQ